MIDTAYVPERASTFKSSSINQTGSSTVRGSNCNILLHNFQIKKKNYRVLLNGDHFVWERIDGKRNKKTEITGKEELEAEQLSTRSSYGKNSHVLHLNELIRIGKGKTKVATLHNISQNVNNQNYFPPIALTEQGDPHTISQIVPSNMPSEQYLTIHYAERIEKSESDCNRWQIQTLTLFNSDPYIIQQWYEQLKESLMKFNDRRVRHLLVFINPYGGRKYALQTYERFCKPLFQLAGIDASCIISQRANQIRDILMNHDLAPFDAVCCVGGDGTVAEVINGLIFRRIRDLGLNPRQPDYIPKPALPVGIIPAGSTDTVAYSLHGTADVRTAAIHVILGQRRGLDICSVHNRNGLIKFCASVLSYGYLGDVAAKSENYRWMGPKRYEYTGVKSFLLNRAYKAQIRLLLQDSECDNKSEETSPEVNRSIKTQSSVCYANCSRCSLAQSIQQEQSIVEGGESETDDEIEEVLPLNLNESPAAHRALDKNDEKPANEIIKHNNQVDNISHTSSMADCDRTNKSTQFVDGVPVSPTPTMNTQNSNSFSYLSNSIVANNRYSNKQWKIVKGDFFMVCGANITCACLKSPNGISRYSHLGDGVMDLILVRKTSLINNIRLVLNMMGRNGDIRNLPFVEIYRTRKFIFQALSSDEENLNIRNSCQPIAEPAMISDDSISSWNCDGEVLHDLEITMRSHCQLIDVFMRGPYAFNSSANTKDSILCCCN